MQARLAGVDVEAVYQDFPTVSDGVRGMRFIEKVVASSNSDEKWLKF